jgi:hypothetical protein
MVSHVRRGNSKQLIIKFGMAWTTVLSKVSIPALDAGLPDSPLTYFQILSKMNLNVAVGDLPTEVGIPT